MAKLTPGLRAKDFCLHSHGTTSRRLTLDSASSSLNRCHFGVLPSKQLASSRISCSIKDKEAVKETGKFGGLVDRAGVLEDSEAESGAGEAELRLNWPPWKNIPERYKVIGTTSLAFVICNMDKVGSSLSL